MTTSGGADDCGGCGTSAEDCAPGSEEVLEGDGPDCPPCDAESPGNPAPGCAEAFEPVGECGFRMDDAEAALFASYAEEQASFAGVRDTEYYILSQTQHFDPLYRESATSEGGEGFGGPWRVTMTLEFDEGEQGQYTSDATEEGVEREYDAISGVTMAEWCGKIPGSQTVEGPPREPQEGDVIVFYATTRYPRFFSVLRVERTGYVGTTGNFVGWKLSLKDRKSFTARRRLAPVQPQRILRNNA